MSSILNQDQENNFRSNDYFLFIVVNFNYTVLTIYHSLIYIFFFISTEATIVFRKIQIISEVRKTTVTIVNYYYYHLFR